MNELQKKAFEIARNEMLVRHGRELDELETAFNAAFGSAAPVKIDGRKNRKRKPKAANVDGPAPEQVASHAT